MIVAQLVEHQIVSLTVTGSSPADHPIMKDFTNFYIETTGNWTLCKCPSRRADFKSTDSSYWDLGDRVVRKSNHWGIVGSCFWQIDNKPKIRKALIKARCAEILYVDLFCFARYTNGK